MEQELKDKIKQLEDENEELKDKIDELEYDRSYLIDMIDEMKRDIQENYVLKNINPYDEYGLSEDDFH